MEESTASLGKLAATSKQFVRRLATIGENRLELLAVEVHEERERLRHVILLGFGVAAFGLLAGVTLTAAIVFLLWPWSPAAVLIGLTILYAAIGGCLYDRLNKILRGWQTLSASIDQLRKDRECLEKILT
jgi:uncharacterized membrane protein YqjE